VNVTVVEPYRGGEPRLVRDDLLEEERWFSETEADGPVPDRAGHTDRATDPGWCPA
jgi:hypothetical protein